jgi:molybdate transport system ATP-binding protein
VFSPGSVRVEVAAPEDAAAVANEWTGRVAQLDPIPGGIRLHTAEHPEIAVDCPSTHAVALGLHPGQLLTFRVAEADVSLRVEAPRDR